MNNESRSEGAELFSSLASVLPWGKGLAIAGGTLVLVGMLIELQLEEWAQRTRRKSVPTGGTPSSSEPSCCRS